MRLGFPGSEMLNGIKNKGTGHRILAAAVLSLLVSAAGFSRVGGGLSPFIISAEAATSVRSIPNVRIKIERVDTDQGYLDESSLIEAVTVPDNSYYTLDEVEPSFYGDLIRIGDKPVLTLRLEAYPKEVEHSRYDEIYLFSGGYSASNVSVSGGRFLSAVRRDSGYALEVAVELNAVRGTYDVPAAAEWGEPFGTAYWLPNAQDSGCHDIYLYRGSSVVKKLTKYMGGSYNFYPYLTGEGEYRFKIRATAPPDSDTGKNSEWLESGILYVGENEVSDGSGQTASDEYAGGQYGGPGAAFGGGYYPNAGTGPGANTGQGSSPGYSGGYTDTGGYPGGYSGQPQYPNGTGSSFNAGWTVRDGYTYFIYPDGSCARSGWLRFNGSWYMFDDNGHRLTGWQQNRYGKWFYMDPDTAAMRTGWLKDNGLWYYLETDPGDTEGCMRTGWLDYKGHRYYLNMNGVMVTGWFKIDGYYRYFYPEGNGVAPEGAMAQNTKVGDFSFDGNGIWR